MVGAIDSSHIPLLYELQRGLTPMPCDIFNKKKFTACCYKICTIRISFFGMFVQDNWRKYIMLRSLPNPNFTHNYEDEIYCLIRF